MKLYGQDGLGPFDLLLLLREAVRAGRLTDDATIKVYDEQGTPIQATVAQVRSRIVDYGVTTYLQ
jgi:hypothetical protein